MGPEKQVMVNGKSGVRNSDLFTTFEQGCLSLIIVHYFHKLTEVCNFNNFNIEIYHNNSLLGRVNVEVTNM